MNEATNEATSEAMSAEFDTMAEWTAEAAIALGPEYYVPAACRGSGSPRALDWLIDRLDLRKGQTLLDSGAGVGGPATYAAQRRGVDAVLVEPELGACRAARKLFDHPVVQASGSRIPLHNDVVNASWALGVLCTMTDQLDLLTELRRVVRPGGRVGVLVFVLREHTTETPDGNHFPTVDGLTELIDRAGLRIDEWAHTSDLPPVPADWQDREDAVTDRLREERGATRVWQLSEEQSRTMSRLLKRGVVTGELLTLHAG